MTTPTASRAHGTATVVRGDARALPLPDRSVDLIVTSPPYYALRSYTDSGGEHYVGQVGDEPAAGEYIANLLACTREWMRVLKPSGSLWVNLGDRYAGSSSGPRSGMPDGSTRKHEQHECQTRAPRDFGGIRPKSLLGLPWRYALACIDDLGLILRAEVVWAKPNALPESVVDRVSRSHETWFHLVREPRYYSAVDDIRECYAPSTAGRYTTGYRPGKAYAAGQSGSNYLAARDGGPSDTNPRGRLPGSVWTIASEPLRLPEWLGVEHFAAYPTALVRRIVEGWSPPGICIACGEARRPSVRHEGRTRREQADVRGGVTTRYGATGHNGLDFKGTHGVDRVRYATGYVCACTPHTDHPGTGEPHRNGNHPSGGNAGVNINARTRHGVLGGAPRVGPWREYHTERWTPPATRAAVVLDPFGGTGTTALVARALGRHGVSVDLSGDYCRVARWRVSDPAQLAKVLGVPKPPTVPEAQQAMFDAVTP